MNDRRTADFRFEAGPAKDLLPPNFTEILSGILALAGRQGESIAIPIVHSTLYGMKPHEPVLSGLHFSLTGDVCYSSNIDRAIKNLIVWGAIRIVDESTVAIERIHPFRKHLSRFLSNSQFQAVHSTSLRYHERLKRKAKTVLATAGQ